MLCSFGTSTEASAPVVLSLNLAFYYLALLQVESIEATEMTLIEPLYTIGMPPSKNVIYMHDIYILYSQSSILELYFYMFIDCYRLFNS